MDPQKITAYGDELYEAWLACRPVRPLLEREPDITIEDAYLIQERFVARRVQAGETIIGKKIGATDYVLPCFEIVDSRITDWKIKIQDTVADNASCGVYVLGKTKGDPRQLDITLAGMVLEKNRELFSTGVGAAVQGSPANAVAWLANTLGELGIPFKAGEVILSGSQSALVPVVDGDELVCTVGGLGTCSVKFSGRSKA